MQGAFLYVLTTVLMFTGWYFSSTGREEGRVPYVNWGKFGLPVRASRYFSVLGCGVQIWILLLARVNEDPIAWVRNVLQGVSVRRVYKALGEDGRSVLAKIEAYN